VKKRVFEATGVEVDPIYYCAGYKEDGKVQNRPYNLSKLFYYILEAIPSTKRVSLANNVNPNSEMWDDDDERDDYREKARRSILDSVMEGMDAGGDLGEEIGSIFGDAGARLGRAAGRVVGGVIGFIRGLF